METRYKVYQRHNGIYYIQDVVTNQQESLRTRDKKKALALLVARNQAASQPALNVTMAKAYLSGRSPELAARTWNDVFEEMILGYDGSTKKRFRSFAKSAPVQHLKRVPLIETDSSQFLNALRHPRAGSSTNKWMRIVHNRALDLGWLLSPVLARKVWPTFRTKKGIAITVEQHRRLVNAEKDEEFARYLEILWEMLGDHYGTVLEDGGLKLGYEAGHFLIHYSSHKLPISPETYGRILGEIDNLLPSGDERKTRLRDFSAAFEGISRNNPENREEQLHSLQRDLAELFATDSLLEKCLKSALTKFNGVRGDPPSFGPLHELLEKQHYRLSNWKVGAHEVNYRRFFAVDTLIGLKMEKPEVFAATHHLLGELISSRTISGIRLDHIDGLWNPSQYLQRLEHFVREKLHGGGPIYTLVEKIIAPNEKLPEAWAIHGTSGYEFAASLIELFLDRADEPSWTRIYSDFTSEQKSSRDLTYEDKIFILQEMFPNAVSNLAVELDNLIEPDWHWRDLSLHDLKTALRHLLACLPVYRTYRMPGEVMNNAEKDWISQAVGEAIRRNPCIDPAPIRFLGRVIDGEYPPEGVLNAKRPDFERWVCKLQQATGAVMAKSVEDTHFFRYVRMVAANEVGSHPSRFGRPVFDFHQTNLQRREQMPYCMLTTSTHDTKMSEDSRARLFALAELPEEWEQQLSQWTHLNENSKREVAAQQAPDAREEYLLYQMMLSAWPSVSSPPDDSFRQRMKAYFRKAQGEAKLHTAWTYPHEEWHAAGESFIDAIFTSSKFWESFVPFAQRLAYRGMIFSLAQTVLKFTSPGIPDLYQGNEIWDYSLVDPDNRRPVDFDARRSLLLSLDSRAPSELLRDWPDGGIKMQVIRTLLHCRSKYPDLFTLGEYVPVSAIGHQTDSVVAFLRKHESTELLVVVPRRLGKKDRTWVGAAWNTAAIPIDENRNWKNLLTGNQLKWQADHIPLTTVFADLPVAVFLST